MPSEGAFFGSRVAERDGETAREAIGRVEEQIGRRFDIDHSYYTWYQDIPTAHQRWDVNTGRLPFVNWRAGVRWNEIANGSQDAWIRERADAFADFGAPIYLAFHHEPEDDLGAYGAPTDYAAAFRRIVDVFRGRGVTNVGFVWNMMAWSFDPRSGRDPDAYYPGDGYVDFVGANGYSRYDWRLFGDIFPYVNAWSEAHGKPWMIVEYGCLEDPAIPGRKGDWFRDALATVRSWPGLKAVIYFDSLKDGYNWVTDSSESSMQGYREMANDPWFLQLGGPVPTPSPTPTPAPPPGGTRAIVRNGLNAGPQGATIRTSGSQRGGGPTPFSAVSTTRGASLTYDNTHARGAFSARHALNERSDAYYQWSGTRSVWYGRIFLWLDAHPAGDLRLVRAWSSSDDALRCSINIRSSGRVAFQDRDNRWIAESGVAIPTGRWVRIEWKVDHRRGRVKIKIFANARSTRPTEVLRIGPRLDIGSDADQFQFGRSGSNDFPITFWTDSPALSTRRFLGPGTRR